jgi:AraC family transcriptional regulator of adaptative response/methylated-DNA-[protein]-cysteine methyltransferase
MPFETDEARWRAVQERDRNVAGAFVYSVRTTGIFCRPGCPSRTPNRPNVGFHDTPEEAMAMGFRPCLRCRPTG